MDVGEDMGPPQPGEPIGWYDVEGDGIADTATVSGGAPAMGIDITLRDPLRWSYLPSVQKTYHPLAVKYTAADSHLDK